MTINKLSNSVFVILIFSIVFDPGNSILHLKNLSFFLFLVLTLNKKSYRNFWIVLLFQVIFFVTFAFQLLIPNTTIDYPYLITTYKSFILFILLLYCEKKNILFTVFYYSNLIVAVLCNILWLIMFKNQGMETFLYGLLTNGVLKENFGQVIFVARRSFIGIKVFQVFYKTSPLAILCLAYSSYNYLEYRFKRYLIHSIIFFFYLFVSGTRMNILCAASISIWALFYHLIRFRKFVLASALFSFSAISGILLLNLLLADKADYSLNVKTMHVVSYNNLFESNPIRYLFIGDGPGAEFFTLGFNKMTSVTELSYYDLIRNFGLVFAIVILIIYLLPMINSNKKNPGLGLSMSIGYLLYLSVAGTNPFLFSSTGVISYIIMFYISRNVLQLKKLQNKKKHKLNLLSIFFKYNNFNGS